MTIKDRALLRLVWPELRRIRREYLWREARDFMRANDWLNDQREAFMNAYRQVTCREALLWVWHKVIP